MEDLDKKVNENEGVSESLIKDVTAMEDDTRQSALKIRSLEEKNELNELKMKRLAKKLKGIEKTFNDSAETFNKSVDGLNRVLAELGKDTVKSLPLIEIEVEDLE
jgi:hypothetical protein